MTEARHSSSRGIHRFRRASQLAFLLLFLVLLTLTVWPLGSVALGVFLGADPLIALESALNGVWLWPGFLAVGMLALPLFAGRAFCGYACPMGTIVEITTPVAGPGGVKARARKILRTVPTFVLVGSAGLALFGSGAFLFFDPLATLTRSATLLLYPLLDRGIRLVGDVAYLAPALRDSVDTVTGVLSGRLIFTRPLVYATQLGTLAMFSAILAISWIEPRMWCRRFCPLGALLGLVGAAAVAGRTVDASACVSCGRCTAVCPMDAVSDDYIATSASRCQSCYQCADACPESAIHLGWRPDRTPFSASRRQVLAAGGLAALAGFFTLTGVSRYTRDPRLVRPPGARGEDELLALCSRCGQCMKVCPTNVLQPAVTSAGVEGYFTPRMDFRTGSCEWSCNECGKVCPTGAIGALPLPVKRKTVIGRAYIDRNRCIPWADGRTCLVCQELCPVPSKAITITPAEITTPTGARTTIGRPEVVAEKCIGCGVCENVCPVPHRAAVEVYGRTAGDLQTRASGER